MKVRSIIVLFLFISLFSLLSFPFVFGGEPPASWFKTTTTAPEQSSQPQFTFWDLVSTVWFWLIVVGIFILIFNSLIFSHLPIGIARFPLTVGLRILGYFLIFIGFVLGEIDLLQRFALLVSSGWNFQSCESIPQLSISDPLGLLFSATCILSGFTPAGSSFDGLIVFYILGVMAPFISIFYFFKEALDFFENSAVRKVLEVSLSFVVYRSIAKFLIPLLAYGIAGVVGFLVDFFILRAAFSSKSLKVMKEAKRKVEEKIGELLNLYDYYIEMRQLEKAKKVKKEIDELSKQV